MLHSFIYLIVAAFVTTEYAGIEHFVIVEPIFFLTALFFSNLGRQRRNIFFTSVSFFAHLVLAAVKIICMFIPASFGINGSFRSPTVIYLMCLLKGEPNIYDYLSYSGIRPYFWVVFISIAFYVAVMLVLLINFLYSLKKIALKRKFLSGITEKTSVILSVPCVLLAVVICVQFTWGMLNRGSILKKEKWEAENEQTPHEVYIYESDEPTDISALSDYSIVEWNYAEGSWDYLFYIQSRIIKSSYQADSFYDYWYETPPEYIINDKDIQTFISKDYKGVFEYCVCTDEISFKPSKKYVYVLPIYDYLANDEGENEPEIEHDEYNWINTSKQQILNYKIDDKNTLILTIEANE